ncbi:Os11g0467500 [Oryza sativa Japonica Group]|uniref:Os11g0467500 protein n=1 Tax=Oryza sativa subsp. japonica TaxID=39947 RepID=C7J8D8_ORYSJ|nr:Os11g0467500 [Oryza sativa Japonica Group]|eukprot:NP_001176532.1 Os11g0467500 [Oryza sativa Japonica Group]
MRAAGLHLPAALLLLVLLTMAVANRGGVRDAAVAIPTEGSVNGGPDGYGKIGGAGRMEVDTDTAVRRAAQAEVDPADMMTEVIILREHLVPLITVCHLLAIICHVLKIEWSPLKNKHV